MRLSHPDLYTLCSPSDLQMTKYMTAQEMTKRDMVAARMQTSVQVARVRDYLYGQFMKPLSGLIHGDVQ